MFAKGTLPVALSTCELGRRRFVDPFKRRTWALVVVAPRRVVPFLDAAVWFVHYYYFLLQNGLPEDRGVPQTVRERGVQVPVITRSGHLRQMMKHSGKYVIIRDVLEAPGAVCQMTRTNLLSLARRITSKEKTRPSGHL